MHIPQQEIVDEARKIIADDIYGEYYGYESTPFSVESISQAAQFISERVSHLIKALYLVVDGELIDYKHLIDIFNYAEYKGLPKRINPKVWDEIRTNINKWGTWNKAYYGKTAIGQEDVISSVDVMDCERFCVQFEKYLQTFIKRMESQ